MLDICWVRRRGGARVGCAVVMAALICLLDRRGGSWREAARVVGTLWRDAVVRACAGRWLVSTLERVITLGGEVVVRAWRHRRDDSTTAFSWAPAASSVRGAATATATGQSAGWVSGWIGASAELVAAASVKIVRRLVRSWSCFLTRWRVWCPQICDARSTAAARIASAGVTAVFVRYLLG